MISIVRFLPGGVLLLGLLLFTFLRTNIVMAEPCLADINQDGSVNGGDMMILTEEMGREDCHVSPCQTDFNGDGKIDGEDKAIFQSEFGRYDCLSIKEDKFRENINVFQKENDVQLDEDDKAITSDDVDEQKSPKEETSVLNSRSRFKDNGNGTVLDLKTGLMWTKDANLSGDTMLFHQALDYIAGMNEGEYSNFGYTDWRLPALNELRSLIDYTKLTNKGHVLPVQHPFKNVQSLSLYRQSVTYLSTTDHSLFVSLYCRLVGHNVTFCHGYVWPVRGEIRDQL